MTDNKITSYCLEALLKAGAQKSQCVLTRNRKFEMNVEAGEMSLLRTTFDVSLSLSAIKDYKKGSISINKVDIPTIDEAIVSVIELAETSEVDRDFDISSKQVPKEYISGDGEPDIDRMYDLMKNFINSVKAQYPSINIIESALTFNQSIKYYTNSNMVDFKESKGLYYFSIMFASKSGEKSSSFNYTGCSMKKLDKELLDTGTVKNLLVQSVEQLNTEALEGKFVGDVIITPDCLSDFIDYYVGVFLGDRGLISGTSLLKDKLMKVVASSKLTLSSSPVSSSISDGYFVTQDGFEAKNVTLIQQGVLKSFMLSLYGANKTKLERAKNSGGAYIVEKGDKSLKDIIQGIEKGIVISRFSGGNPSASGDFSGVAKNSYYIEKGEIKYPISETMVSGNLLDIFTNIKEISEERIDFGSAIFPWICSSGVTITGK